MSENALVDAEVADLERLLQVHITSGQGFEKVLGPIREFCDAHGWDWFTRGKRQEFNRRCAYLHSAYSYGLYSNSRRVQLAEMDLWVYRANPLECPDRHQELDGLILPRTHPFWQNYYPPLDPKCHCYVVGAHTERGAARMGGQIGKEPPAWTAEANDDYTMASLLLDIMNDNLPPLEEA